MAERLSQREHEMLEEFLCTVLDDFSKGNITRHQAVSGIATLYTAAAEGRREEILEYLRKGRKLLRGEPAEFGKNRTLRFSGHP
ncbi:hypothetical protein [Citrobacter sp. RHBSTW-00671]|uniref:hypothetical protein n=1 Tax=Citrobacter sp. RHBSTW-00671 TaxID=2742660 RepID=UPI0017EC6513|nr:hypothetical protein [Citrobacter sp. RHBSTW-00671]MBA7969763.1 hypothetical protein [Citrobacter sp. RHBSTW-00671]